MMALLSLLGGIPGLISGLFTTVNGITAAISNEKIAVINAKTAQEATEAQERVNTLSMRRDVMIAEAAQSKLNIYIRACLALGPMVLLFKIFIWDKAMGPFFGCVGKVIDKVGTDCKMFTTDSLDPNLWQVVMVVLGFYFLCEGATGVARIIKTGGWGNVGK